MTDKDVERELEENEQRAEAHDRDRENDTSIPGLIETAVNPLLTVFDPERKTGAEREFEREDNDDAQREGTRPGFR
jgi:hypothetical protein